MTRAPKATWARPAKGTAVPLSRETGAVKAECSAATQQDRPVAGVPSISVLMLIVVVTTSSTSCRCALVPANYQHDGR